ncbi:MAG: FtsW/RodA/SpoVE family cell cycle protein [Clostridia bacterium]|nr:FtsW/RodA/SpoVE family cell cycle protein [Clostridia bacterium]
MNADRKAQQSRLRRRKYHAVDRGLILLILTVFQAVIAMPVYYADNTLQTRLALEFGGFILFEWLYVGIMHFLLKKKNFELEFIAFFLSGIGLTLIAASQPKKFETQLIMTIGGIIVYDILLWFLQDVKRVMAVRFLVGIAALGVLGVGFLLAKKITGNINGAYNWIIVSISGYRFSFQPSEFAKIAFVFVGAASLDKLLTSKNIYLYVGFSMASIGILCVMRDLGAAMVYFMTFLVLAFLRSGDVRSFLFLGVSLALGGGLGFAVMRVLSGNQGEKITRRLKTYLHVWNDPLGKGYQQVQMLINSAAGGLFGVGVGKGIGRGTTPEGLTDTMFGVICEELGWIIAFAVLATYGFLLYYAVRVSRSAPSTFYSISACAAATMLLAQAALHVFGSADLLPFTGVTLPFISQGGSSMICCWGLLAFLKAADIRTYPKVFKQMV